jgi:hypothetical protein
MKFAGILSRESNTNGRVSMIVFDVGVDYLVVEKLCALQLACDSPCVVVEKPTQEGELPLSIEDRNVYIVRELARERLHALVQPCKVGFDLGPQQRLHAVVGELSLEFSHCSRRVTEESPNGCAQPLLRPGALQHHNIEDLNLIETVALRLEEPTAMVDGSLDDRVVILGKWNLGTVEFE